MNTLDAGLLALELQAWWLPRQPLIPAVIWSLISSYPLSALANSDAAYNNESIPADDLISSSS